MSGICWTCAGHEGKSKDKRFVRVSIDINEVNMHARCYAFHRAQQRTCQIRTNERGDPVMLRRHHNQSIPRQTGEHHDEG